MNLKELLELTVQPYLSEHLISPNAFERINQITSHLPEQLTSFFGFECRLGNANPTADFLLCVFRDTYGHSILANNSNDNPLPSSWLKHPVWQNIITFAQHWSDKMDHLWLEFDIAEDTNSGIPVPSFFFAPFDTQQNTFLKPQNSLSTILAGLKRIKASALEESIQQQLQKVVHELPSSALIFQVGTMLARPIPTCRVCIRDIYAIEIPVFLRKMQWKGDVRALYERLEKLYKMVDRVDLDIDVLSTGIASKIGLECYLNIDHTRAERWQILLNYLADNHLCTHAKKEALATVNGIVHQGMVPKNSYPNHLQQMAGFIGKQHTSMYFRDIHHIKLSFEKNTFLEAKAYLRVKHIWVSNAKLKTLLQKQNQLSKTA